MSLMDLTVKKGMGILKHKITNGGFANSVSVTGEHGSSSVIGDKEREGAMCLSHRCPDTSEQVSGHSWLSDPVTSGFLALGTRI